MKKLRNQSRQDKLCIEIMQLTKKYFIEYYLKELSKEVKRGMSIKKNKTAGNVLQRSKINQNS